MTDKGTVLQEGFIIAACDCDPASSNRSFSD